MAQLRSQISISLDGFTAGPDPSDDEPLGVGGERLHEWAIANAAWRTRHGYEGGEVDASTPILEQATENVGAHVMGRNMFGGGSGPWGEGEARWDGWWGEEPPFRTPVFVLTHHAREPLVLGATTFHFVSDGLEPALTRAFDAADGTDVSVAGGAEAIRRCLAAGLLDELQLHVVPVLLGGGTRLLDGLDRGPLGLEPVDAVHAPGVTHVTYRKSA